MGFPDINTIEPLAAALDVSVAELMKSERIDESEMSIAMNNEIVNNALNFAEKQIQQERKKCSLNYWMPYSCHNFHSISG